MLHIKFQSNQPSGSGEGVFLRFLPYMIMEAILAMCPGPFEQILDPLLPRCCIWNLIETGPVVSKKSFENVDKHSILSDLWPRSLNDLDLWHSQEVHVVPTFVSQSTIVLEKCNVSPFCHSRSQGTKFDLDKNGSRSTEGHHLKKFSSTQSTDTTYQVSSQSAQWF